MSAATSTITANAASAVRIAVCTAALVTQTQAAARRPAIAGAVANRVGARGFSSRIKMASELVAR
jgi:hypothetical protein